MKKSYIAPELQVELIQPEGLMALSLLGTADESDALVKENESGDWEDIWDKE